jgi:beta-glucosidase-like glycosyl hydrolase
MALKQIIVADVVAEMGMDEKVALISAKSIMKKNSFLVLTSEPGVHFWRTALILRLNIPSIRISDVPNGIRGTKFFNNIPVACFPYGTALGAT